MSMAIPLLLVLVAAIAGIGAWRGGGGLPGRTRTLLAVVAAIALIVAVVQVVAGHRA